MKENKELVRKFYDRLWNQWDYAVAETLLADNIVFRGSIGLTKHGRTGFIAYADIIRSAFPDFHNSIRELIAEGGKVVARLTYSGTHRGEIFGSKPSGKKFEYEGVAIFTIENGKISEVWVLGDLVNLMKQLSS